MKAFPVNADIIANDRVVEDADEIIGDHAELLSEHLLSLNEVIFPPTAQKTMRTFPISDVAMRLGVSENTIRKEDDVIFGDGLDQKRAYTLAQINQLRAIFAKGLRGTKPSDFQPYRGPGDHLQVIAVTNFKGGSGKTTTTTHMAQHLALEGYRVLAVDLDPQASLSAMLGVLPERDVGANQTLYAAIRYDDDKRPLGEVIRKTYFDGLDLVPGNLELMEFEHTTPKALIEGTRSGGDMFFARIATALDQVADRYDVVVIDCPPQLGFLTLSGLCAATSMIVTVHPQMLDVSSMNQFLLMTRDLLSVVRDAGGKLRYDFIRYLLTRYEPQDGPQTKVAAMLRNLFGDHVMTNAMVKSTAVSDAGLTRQTLYEIDKQSFGPKTYNRVMEYLVPVNLEIENLIRGTWGWELRQPKDTQPKDKKKSGRPDVS